MEARGERIQGSKLFRDFCCKCGEPIRVSKVVKYGIAVCDDCNTPSVVQGDLKRTRIYYSNINYHGGTDGII